MLRPWLPLLIATSSFAQQPIDTRQNDEVLRAMAQAERKNFVFVEEPAVQEYVEALGGRLAAQFPASPAFTFSIIADDPSVLHEPVSLPGGYLFIPVQLFLTASNEAEFAGVLAHAMAHVARGHLTRATPDGARFIFVDASNGRDKDNIPLPVQFSKLKSGFELQADQEAVRALAASGFDPAALASYIDRVQPGRSTYPPRSDRVAAIRSAARQAPPVIPPSNEDFSSIQEELHSQFPKTVRAVPSLGR